MIDHCKRTVTVLQAMVEKHGAQGGLDSHVEDITNAVHGAKFTHTRSTACAIIRVSPVSLCKVKLLKVASWEAIKR